jgi:hypothetical protein
MDVEKRVCAALPTRLRVASAWHAGEQLQEDRWVRISLLMMPGEQHVFLAFATGVTDQREGQGVFVRAAKLICAGSLAAFRSFTSRLLDCDGIASDSVLAPNVALRIHNLEGAVGFDRPDSAERIGPCAGERGWTGPRSGGSAGIHEHEQNACENDSEKVLNFHAVDPVGSHLKVKARSQRRWL